MTAGINGAIRIFEHASDGEPHIIDISSDEHTAIVATNDSFIIGCAAGEVYKYNLTTKRMDEILTRCTGAINDLALSPDGKWVAVASEYVLLVRSTIAND